jgi:hypothetical protein
VEEEGTKTDIEEGGEMRKENKNTFLKIEAGERTTETAGV